MNRTLPWNQLGTEIVSAVDVKDALTMANLDFEVFRNPVFDHQGNVINGFFANTNSKTNEVLGIVGKNYRIVQNLEAFDFVDNLISAGVSFERAGLFHHGKAVWLLAKMPETDILGDNFAPYIVFINSFDGTGAIKIAMTPIRIACSNALNFALRSAQRTWSTKHMGDIFNKLEEAKYTLGLANNYMSELAIEAERLANKKMSDSEFEVIFDKIFPVDLVHDSARKIRNIEEIKNAMFNGLNASDISQFSGTAYSKINAVTDIIDHMSPARMTDSFRENNWAKIATGHSVVDAFYREIAA